MSEGMPHWQRIQFCEWMAVGKAYVIQLEDEREPAKFVQVPTGRMVMDPVFGFPRPEMTFTFRRPMIPTLVVNRRTLGL